MEIHIVVENREEHEKLWQHFRFYLPLDSFVISKHVDFGIRVNTEGFTSDQNRMVFK